MSLSAEIEDVAEGVRGYIAALPAFQKMAAREALGVVDKALARLDELAGQVQELEIEHEESKAYG